MLESTAFRLCDPFVKDAGKSKESLTPVTHVTPVTPAGNKRKGGDGKEHLNDSKDRSENAPKGKGNEKVNRNGKGKGEKIEGKEVNKLDICMHPCVYVHVCVRTQ